MAHFLLLYGSEEGQTEKVTRALGDVIQQAGHQTTLLSGRNLTEPFPLDAFDAVFVGASVHVGRHQRYIADFVQAHHEQLAALPTAFLSVSLAAGSDTEEHRLQAVGYIEAFMRETGWQPDVVCACAGALHYSQYDELQLFILEMAGAWVGETDVDEDVEYTDWYAVEQFAERFLELVEKHGNLILG